MAYCGQHSQYLLIDSTACACGCVCVCGTDCCKRGTELHGARQLPDWLWLLGGISHKDGFSGSLGAYLGLANSFVSFTILLCCAPCVSFSSLLCLYYVVCLHSFSIFNALWLCVGHRLATLFIVPVGINFVNCCCPIVVVTTTATTTTTTTWLSSFVVVVIAACRIKLYQQLSRVSLCSSISSYVSDLGSRPCPQRVEALTNVRFSRLIVVANWLQYANILKSVASSA